MGFYTSDHLGLSFMLFIDEVEVFKNAKIGKNVCMFYLAINELDGELRFKKRHLLPLGAFQTRVKVPASVISPITTQLQMMFYKPQNIKVYHYEAVGNAVRVTTKTFKVKCILLGVIIGNFRVNGVF